MSPGRTQTVMRGTRAVYRDAHLVVRQGLTNALRYASGAPIGVVVRGQPHALLVKVTNGLASHSVPLVGQGSGRGLQGLRERLDTHAGQLTAGPTPDGGWQLQVTLPQRDMVTPTTEPPNPRTPGPPNPRTPEPRTLWPNENGVIRRSSLISACPTGMLELIFQIHRPDLGERLVGSGTPGLQRAKIGV